MAVRLERWVCQPDPFLENVTAGCVWVPGQAAKDICVGRRKWGIGPVTHRSEIADTSKARILPALGLASDDISEGTISMRTCMQLPTMRELQSRTSATHLRVKVGLPLRAKVTGSRGLSDILLRHLLWT